MQTQVRAGRERPREAQRSSSGSDLSPREGQALGREGGSSLEGARPDGSRATTAQRVAKGLGWFSIGLGLAEVAAPWALTRLIGIRNNDRARTTLRALGMREIATGVAILTRPKEAGWVWGRVAGDMVDLAFLGDALTSKKSDAGRVLASTAAVGSITVLDALTAWQLSRSVGPSPEAKAEKRRVSHTQSVTIHAGVGELEAMWRDFEAKEDTKHGAVRFVPAPAGRGTEIHVEHETGHGMAVKALIRRFKQVVETGEIVHSDASIHKGPHPARPSHKEMQVPR